MQRALVTIAAAGLLCGLSTLLLGFFLDRGVPLAGIVLFTAATTLLLSVGAAVFAAAALLRAAALRTDIARLSRSLDSAVRELSARGDRNTADLGDMRAAFGREPSPTLIDPATPLRAPSNVFVLPPARRFRPELVTAPAAPSTADDDDARLLALVEAALAFETAEIVLRPLASVARGNVAGYEVATRIARHGGAVEINRLPETTPDPLLAAFEHRLLVGAVDAAQRHVGADMPLHVPASEALMSNGRELASAIEALNAASECAPRIVVVLPARIFDHTGHADAITLLMATGVQMAAQDWLGTDAELETLLRRGVSAIRVSADLLLGRSAEPVLLASPVRMIETAAACGLPLVATGVADDSDAVAMLDLGVGQMTGERFAGRRRLKPGARRDAAGG